MIPKEDLAIQEGVKVVDLIIQTDETARQTFFLDTFLSHNLPLLLVGPTGELNLAWLTKYCVFC